MPFVSIVHIQNKIPHSFIFRLHVHGITEVLFVGVGGDACISLVSISNKVSLHFEELAMSMSVFSPSLCHLSPFDIVLCRCFKPILINVRILP